MSRMVYDPSFPGNSARFERDCFRVLARSTSTRFVSHHRGAAARVSACIFCVFSLLLAAKTAAQQEPEPDPIRVSVITFGRGSAIHQYFGHNAFVIDGATVPRPSVFNYGMFSFGPDMLPQFLRGRLRFWLGTADLQQTVDQYARANRDVRQLELNLTPSQRRFILGKLLHDAQPENRFYLYDHYFDNCSTRVRDVLDAALRGQLRRAWSAKARFTLRQDTMRYTQHDVLTEWMMMLLLNNSVDRAQTVWGEAFLPLELETLLEYTTYIDDDAARVPLVSKVNTLFRSDRPERVPPNEPEKRWPSLLGVGAVIGLCLLLLGERARVRPKPWRAILLCCMALFGVCGGLVGTLLVYLSLWSDHLVTHGNGNILLLNPLTLLAGVLSIAELAVDAHSAAAYVLRRSVDALWFVTCASSLTLLLLRFSPLHFEQDISLTASLLVPISLGIALARTRLPEPQPAARTQMDYAPHAST